MPVDLKDGQTNVYDLALNSIEQPSLNPDAFLTPLKWQKILSHVSTLRRVHAKDYAATVAWIKLLSAENFSCISLNEDLVLESFNPQNMLGQELIYYGQDALPIKILFPTRPEFLEPGESWTAIVRAHNQYLQNDDPNSYIAEALAYLKVIFPERMHDINLRSVHLKNFYEKLADFVPRRPHFFVSRLAALRILDENYNYNVPAEMVDSCFSYLADCEKQESWEEIVSSALDMKIIAAEKVTVTAEGLQIIDKPVPKNVNSLPHERSF